MDNSNKLAFPVISASMVHALGVTKVEYFAGLAMQAYISLDKGYSAEVIAISAINNAEKLLKQLEKC